MSFSLNFNFNIEVDNILSLIIEKIFNNIFVVNFTGTIDGISNADNFTTKLSDKIKKQTMGHDIFSPPKKLSKTEKFDKLLSSSSSYTIHTI